MSVAVNYFLNASLDTAQTTFALACMKRIDSALSRGKFGCKMPESELLTEIKAEEVCDVLEVFYFNERSVGIEFQSSGKGNRASKVINIYRLDKGPEYLDIDTEEESTDNRKNIYIGNRKKWKAFCLDSLAQNTNNVIPLRKPRGCSVMSSKEWCLLAADISRFLYRKVKYRICRDLNDRWYLLATQ